MQPGTVIIPFRDGHDTLPLLLADLPPDLAVVVVDDVSARQPDLSQFPRVRYLRLDHRGYFAGAVNSGMDACDGDALVLNQDMRLRGTHWRSWLSDQERKGYAMYGTGQMRHPVWPNGYVQGQFMAIRREAWKRVGRFNERDFPLWGNTCEWQLRACRAGFKILPVADLEGVYHLRPQGQSFGPSISRTLAVEPLRRDLLIRTPPLVSVIITSQSYGRYLREAVNSLIGGPTSLGEWPGQTFQAFEVIIVDDASTDETAQVGQELANPWTGIRYLRRKTRGGTSAANNTGIHAAFGKFITILCADDLREPDSLDALYRVVERNPRAVAYDNLYEFASGQRTVKQWLPPAKGKGQVPNFDDLLQKNSMHAGILFARKAWEEVGGYPESMVYGREDWAFNIGLGLKGYCGERVDQFGYLYRREGQNRSLGNQGNEWHTKFMSQLRTLYPDVYRGVKPMGCCGSGGPAVPNIGGATNRNRAAAISPVGAEGMTILNYTGLNTGTEPWYGPVTGARYLFGLKRPQGYVDNRDVPGLLAVVQNRRPIFSRAPATVAPPAAQTKAMPEPPVVTAELVVENLPAQIEPAPAAPASELEPESKPASRSRRKKAE